MIDFYKGVEENLPSAETRDTDTLYVTTDTGKMYLGEVELGKDYDETTDNLQAQIDSLQRIHPLRKKEILTVNPIENHLYSLVEEGRTVICTNPSTKEFYEIFNVDGVPASALTLNIATNVDELIPYISFSPTPDSEPRVIDVETSAHAETLITEDKSYSQQIDAYLHIPIDMLLTADDWTTSEFFCCFNREMGPVILSNYSVYDDSNLGLTFTATIDYMYDSDGLPTAECAKITLSKNLVGYLKDGYWKSLLNNEEHKVLYATFKLSNVRMPKCETFYSQVDLFVDGEFVETYLSHHYPYIAYDEIYFAEASINGDSGFEEYHTYSDQHYTAPVVVSFASRFGYVISTKMLVKIAVEDTQTGEIDYNSPWVTFNQFYFDDLDSTSSATEGAILLSDVDYTGSTGEIGINFTPNPSWNNDPRNIRVHIYCADIHGNKIPNGSELILTYAP